MAGAHLAPPMSRVMLLSSPSPRLQALGRISASSLSSRLVPGRGRQHLFLGFNTLRSAQPLRRKATHLDSPAPVRHLRRSAQGPCRCSLVSVTADAAVAASLFTLSTAAVVPMYTLMLLAPGRPLTKRVMQSSVPWVVLGGIYLYLLALSWTPLTLPTMFSSKYWLPELPGITQMFKSTLTVASAWIHLLALDLYAARGIYFEGLRLGLETRHSICLCLLFAPVGVLCHSLTKVVVKLWQSTKGQEDDGELSDVSLT